MGAEINDGFALLLYLALEKLDRIKLLGITEVSENICVDQGVICALKILKMTDRENISDQKL